MATVLESLGDYVDAQTSWTLGVDLFLGILPDKPDVCVTIMEDSGLAPRFGMGAGGIQIDQPSIMIIARASRDDYPTARDAVNNIRLLLAAVTDQTLSGVRVLRVEPNGSVSPMGADVEHRPLVSTNFNVQVAL
jgi:hypothetical protein